MDTIGLDLHKRESQLCELTEAGEIVERRLVTSRERFAAVLGDRPRARILLEASTESEWVARHLESLGHEVVVADPNFAPMYATRRRGVKTDRRDARTLAEACRLGAYRAIHRASAAQRHVRAQLAVRDALIRTRTRYVSVVRALTRRDGLRLASGGPQHLEAKLAPLPLAPALQAEIAPLRVVLEPLNAQIDYADAQLAATAAGDPLFARLRTGAGGSARRAAHGCARCWSRRAGASCARRIRPRRRCGRGPSGSPSGAGPRSRSSRSRGDWREFSTRCGATGPPTARPPRGTRPPRKASTGCTERDRPSGERVAAYGRW